jgi:tetratricopeptide (TPR) repeat protein
MDELQQQVIFGIVAGVAALVFLITGFALQEDLSFFVNKLFSRKKWMAKKGKNLPPKPKMLWVLFGISGLVSTFSFTAVGLIQLLSPNKEPMTGDFRVVISDFSLNSSQVSKDDQKEISSTTFQRISDALDEMAPDLLITRWGPDELKARRLPRIEGSDPATRAAAAEQLAEMIDADLIVYGSLEYDGSSIVVKPEFYVGVRNFYEAVEMIGQYDLGEPVKVRSLSDVADRVNLNKQLSSRTEALSRMILGLAYYALRDYPNTLSQLQAAEPIKDWKAGQGQHVLYLMEANAVIRQENPDLDQAEAYFRKSLEIQPDYARAMVGLANVDYRRALLKYGATKKDEDLDVALLNQAIDLLNQALASPDQSPLADVPAKVHFELGEINFMLAYCHYQSGYDTAIEEFKAVIKAHAAAGNDHLKERAAESHARLGTIQYMMGNTQEAIIEYQTAIDMLEGYPERQKIYQERIAKINKGS